MLLFFDQGAAVFSAPGRRTNQYGHIMFESLAEAVVFLCTWLHTRSVLCMFFISQGIVSEHMLFPCLLVARVILQALVALSRSFRVFTLQDNMLVHQLPHVQSSWVYKGHLALGKTLAAGPYQRLF